PPHERALHRPQGCQCLAHAPPWIDAMSKPGIEALYKVTEVELIYRGKTRASDRPRVTSSREAYEILKGTWDQNRIELLEQFKILLLDRRNACIGLSEIATGGVAGCVAAPKISLATALKARASGH